MKSKFLFAALLLLVFSKLSAQTYYVSSTAGNDANNGQAWTTAFKTIEHALTQAKANNYKEIRVAVGTYTAPAGDGYVVEDGINIYGGFGGTTGSDYDINMPPTGITILQASGGRTISQITALSTPTIWSGFTIKDGNASLAQSYPGNGGGAYLKDNNMTLRYIHFTNNTANIGGGIYNSNGGIVLSCTISNNTASTTGGGVYNSISKIINSLVTSNQAPQGAGIYYSSGSVTNCTIYGNTASNAGGGIYIYSGNSIKNNIVWGNNTGIFLENTNNYQYITNCIIQDYTTGGSANNNANPQFIYPQGGNFQLLPCSPAIDKGLNTATGLTGITIDITGNARKFNKTADIGAYEYLGKYNNITRLYVNQTAPNGGDGLSWATALNDLDEAIQLSNESCDINQVAEIYVAKGTYKPQRSTDGSSDPRKKSFLLTEWIRIYGGFSGTNNTETPATRDLVNNKTILDGNNSFHTLIIAIPSSTDSTLIDGVNITGGNATISGSTTINTLDINQSYGAGIYATGAGVLARISNTNVYNNTATSGGGIYLGKAASMTMNSGTITGNKAIENGGGVFNPSGTFILTGGIINNNTAYLNGGAIYNNSILTASNGEITGNNARQGGGIYEWGGSSSTLSGTIRIINNAATTLGNEMYEGANSTLNVSGSPTIGTISPAKGLYLATAIKVNVISPISKAEIMFEQPSLAAFGRIMATKATPVSPAELAMFNYPDQKYTLITSGNNIVLGKGTARIINFADSVRTYNGKNQVMTAKASPDSLTQRLQYTYTGTTAKGTIYGPTATPPKDAGNYKVRAYLANHQSFADTDSTVNLRIDPLPINITAYNHKIYGATDPAIYSYTLTPSLAPGDSITGQLTRNQGEAPASYPTQIGTLTAGSNYKLSVKGNFVIEQRKITIKPDDKNKTQNSPEPTYTYSIVAGTPISTHIITTMVTRPDNTSETIGSHQLNIGSIVIQNNVGEDVTAYYSITKETGNLTISAIPLKDQKIDWGTLSSTYTYSNISNIALNKYSIDNTTLLNTNLTVKYFSSDPNVVSVTNNTINIVGVGTAKIRAIQSGNNVYNAVFDEQTITINKKPITITAQSKQKIFGDPDPALLYDISPAMHAGDSITGNLTRSAGEDANTYPITQGTLSAGNNYDITFVDGTFNIVPRPITVIVNSGSSVYGESPSNPGITADGLLNGDDLSCFSTDFNVTATTPVQTNIPINVTGCMTNPNYTLSGIVSGKWSVTPRKITVTPQTGSSHYGDKFKTGFIASGLVNNDNENDLTGLSISPALTATTAAGNYTLNVTGTLTNSNYALAPADTHSATWNIYPAPITVTAIGGSSIYGSSPSNPGFTAQGLVNNEPISVLTGLSNGFGITSNTPSGQYVLKVTGNLSNGNYSLADTDRKTGTWAVNPSELTGMTFKDLTVTYNGKAQSIPVNNLPLEADTISIGNSQINVGTYNVSVTIKKTNYRDTTLTAVLKIVPAPLKIMARHLTIPYGSDPSRMVFTGAYDISGFVNNETEAVLTHLPRIRIDGTINSATPAGTYPGKALVGGASATNYTLNYVSGAVDVVRRSGNYVVFDPISPKTYGDAPFMLTGRDLLGKPIIFGSADPSIVSVTENGSAVIKKPGTVTLYAEFVGDADLAPEKVMQVITIAKANLTVTALNLVKMHNTPNPDATNAYSFGQFVADADISLFTSKPTAIVTLAQNASPGTYPATVSVSGGSHPYYNLNYVAGSMTVVNATNGILFQPIGDKTYGDHAFVLSATHAGGNPVLFESSDPSVISITQSGSQWQAQIHKIGKALIKAYTLAGNGYQATDTTQTVIVNKAYATIRPDDISRGYSMANPALTFSVSGLQYNDKVGDLGAIRVSTTAQQSSPSETYPITATGAANSNYEIIYNEGTFRIEKSAISLIITNGSADYTGNPLHIAPALIMGDTGGSNLNISYTYIKDGITYDSATNAGTYAVTASTAGDENHTSAVSKSVLFVVNKITPVIQLRSKSAIYTGKDIQIDTPILKGANSLPLTYSYKGINGTVYLSTSAPSQSGEYQVTVSTPADENHNAANAIATLTIGEGIPIITMDDSVIVYDGMQHSGKATIMPSNIPITYHYTGLLDNGTPYLSDAAPIEPGKYQVKATSLGNANYKLVTVTANLTILSKGVSIIMRNKSTKYTGLPISIDKPVTNPTGIVLNITYEGTEKTVYPQSALPPSNPGTYVVRASFVGNANLAPASATAILSISPLNVPTLTLDNKVVVYNKKPQPIENVTITPIDSSIKVTYYYSGLRYPTTEIPPTDAGIYSVMALTSESANYSAASVAATLTIEKAEQWITFDCTQLTDRIAGDSIDVASIAVSDAGLPVTIKSSDNAIAKVEANKLIVVRGGNVSIDASQTGDNNYKEANVVKCTLAAIDSLSLKELIVDGTPHNIRIPQEIDCSDDNVHIKIVTAPENAVVDLGKEFDETNLKAGLTEIPFTITSKDGKQKKEYTIRILKKFNFDDIVVQKWNNLLMVDKNILLSEYNMEIDSCTWYQGTKMIQSGTSSYYSAGDNVNDRLVNGGEYSLVIKTTDGLTLKTCSKVVTWDNTNIKAFPNPVNGGEQVNVKADIEEGMLMNATIEVYDLNGKLISQGTKMTGSTASVRMPQAVGTYMLRIKSPQGLNKTLMILVK